MWHSSFWKTDDGITIEGPMVVTGDMDDRVHIITQLPVNRPQSLCSCGNWKVIQAIAMLMCNHWGSAPGTEKRTEQAINAIAACIKLLGADVRAGKVVFQFDVNGNQLPPQWDDNQEKLMGVCPACFRFLLECPAQLPPMERDVVETVGVTEIRRPRARVLNEVAIFARQICERLFHAW